MDWIKGLKATADDRTYTILSGQLDPYPSSELLLVLKIRVSCKGIGIDFTQELFRLDVDGVMKAPPEPGSNYFVPPNSEYAEDVKFIIPKDSHVLKLQVGDSSTPRVAIIPLPLTKP